MPVDHSQRDAVIASINAKYTNAIKKGSEIENPARLSTGSLELDMAMGGSAEMGWGLPMGRISRLAGQYSTGKSLIGLNLIANAQKRKLRCAYINVEKQFTPDFAAARGVDIDALDVVDVGTIEGIAEVIESMLGAWDFFVLDSTKQAISIDALEIPLSDWRPGLEARAWGKAMGVITERFDYNANTLVLIDQVRTKNMMGPGGGSLEPAGGNVLDHASSMTVVLQKGGWLFYDEEGVLTDAKPKKADEHNRHHEGEMVPNGRVIKARVDKSRVSRPLLPATMWMDLNNSNFDAAHELVKWGIGLEVLKETAKGRFEYGTGKNVIKLHGRPKLRRFVLGDLTVQEEIREAAFSRVSAEHTLIEAA